MAGSRVRRLPQPVVFFLTLLLGIIIGSVITSLLANTPESAGNWTLSPLRSEAVADRDGDLVKDDALPISRLLLKPEMTCGLSESAIVEALAMKAGRYNRYFFKGVWLQVRDLWEKIDSDNAGAGKANDPVCVLMHFQKGEFPCVGAGVSEMCLIPYWLRPGTTDGILLSHIIDRQDYNFLAEVNTTLSTIVDAGANSGLATLIFSTVFPNATIIALEPSSENFEILKRNTQYLPNVTPLNVGLWGEVATLFLRNSTRGGEWAFEVVDASLIPAIDWRDKSFAISMSFLQKTFGLSHVDYVKVDIEGSEKEVFTKTHYSDGSHSLEWLDKVKLVSVEVHEDIRSGAENAVKNAFPANSFTETFNGEYFVYRQIHADQRIR